MQFHYLWGSKQLMDKIGGRLKHSVPFFVSTIKKNPSCDHKLLTMKKRKARDSKEGENGFKKYIYIYKVKRKISKQIINNFRPLDL